MTLDVNESLWEHVRKSEAYLRRYPAGTRADAVLKELLEVIEQYYDRQIQTARSDAYNQGRGDGAAALANEIWRAIDDTR